VEGGVVTHLAPDSDHPLSRGYACRKGPAFVHVQNSPERLTQPVVRGADALQATSWEQALAQIGDALAQVRREHGPQAVGLYLGNASGQSLGAVLGATALQEAIGTSKVYSALTLDNSEMFVVLEEVMGNPMASFLADYAGSDCVVLIGTDPLSSQPSQVQSRPGALSELLLRAAAGELVVIDPRESATAKRASLHLRPKLGGEAELLGWLVREALGSSRHRSRAESDALLDDNDLAALAQIVEPCSLDGAAHATGLRTDELTDLCDRLLAAERPLVWSGLGVLLGPHGTLGYWLTVCLQAVLGGLDRPGGYLCQRGPVDLPALLKRLGIKGSDPTTRSRIGDFPAVLGTVAAATLADDILSPGPGQLRALVVLGGNPAISLPDTHKAQRALAALDVLVCIDLFVNDTGALADAVLPAATWLERDGVDLHTSTQRPESHMAVDRAVVAPRDGVRSDWEILLAVARAAGWRPFGSVLADWGLRLTGLGPLGIARLGALLSPVAWGPMAATPGGVTVPGVALGSLRARGTDHASGRLRLAVPAFCEALAEAAALNPPQGETGLALQLLTSVRPVETMNSWMHDTPGAARRVPVARLHSKDLASLGDPTEIVLRRPAGGPSLEVAARADDGVRPGVVVLPYGWGHRSGAVGSGPAGPVGVNANVLVGTEVKERFTGQPVSNGQWVLASAAPAPAPSAD